MGEPEDNATAPACKADALALVWLSLAPRARDLGPATLRTSGYDEVSADTAGLIDIDLIELHRLEL